MNEDDRLEIDVWKTFPEAARRVRVLMRLREVWPSVVRNLSQWSRPEVLGVDGLTVAAENKYTQDRLGNMKGNIVRALSKLGYETDKNFSLNVVIYDRVPKKRPSEKRKVNRNREPDEDKVMQYMKGAPETLPEDINFAISHLMAYLEGVK